jgi:hypothetical protein
MDQASPYISAAALGLTVGSVSTVQTVNQIDVVTAMQKREQMKSLRNAVIFEGGGAKITYSSIQFKYIKG